MSERVLVIDAHERGTLAACRSLADAGYEVSGTAGHWPAPGLWSRSCAYRFRLPRAEIEPLAFIDGLLKILVRGEYAVLLPGGDASLRAISDHRDVLEPHVRIGLPRHEAVQRSLDRLVVHETAWKVGLPVPETVSCEGYDQAAHAAGRIGFPVFVKPRRAGTHSRRVRDMRSRLVWSEGAIAPLVARFDGACLVQRREAGSSCSCSGVMTSDGLLALVFSRYLRMWPPDGGNCAFSETVAAPQLIEQTVERLLSEIGWIGIFELELLWRGDDMLFALDFNPRLYGSLALAVRAGVPLPLMWCEWLLGRQPAAATSRQGVRYRWEDGDARHALWQLLRGDVADAARTARPRRQVAHAYFSWRDPAPLAARLLYLFRRAVVHLVRMIQPHGEKSK